MQVLARYEDIDDNTTLIAASITGAVVGAIGACVGAASRAIVGLGIAGFLTYGFVRIGGVAAIGEDTAIWVVVALCAALAGVVIWKALEAATVVATSLAGALLVIVSLSHFIPGLRLQPLEVFDNPSAATCTAASVDATKTSSNIHNSSSVGFFERNSSSNRGNGSAAYDGNGTVVNGDGSSGGDVVNACMVELICWAVLSSLGLVVQWKLWECMDGNSGLTSDSDKKMGEKEEAWNVESGSSAKKKSKKRRATAVPARAETLKSKSASTKYHINSGRKPARSKSTYARVPAKDRRSGW